MTPQNAEQVKNLRDTFLKFDIEAQNAITHFFNLHNASNFIYSRLSDEEKEYINYCIQLSLEADKIEQENEQ